MKKRNYAKWTLSLTMLCLLTSGLAVYANPPALDKPVHTKLFVRQTSAATPPSMGPTIKGSSARLQRSEDTIWVKINTTQLPAGAYTVWAVIFNNPSACVGGAGNCVGSDLATPAVDGSVFFMTGGTVKETGVGHFRAYIEEGMPTGQVLLGFGLMDAENAEVHTVIRYHGPVHPDPVIALLQTTTVAGGCDLFPCYDPQALIFPIP